MPRWPQGGGRNGGRGGGRHGRGGARGDGRKGSTPSTPSASTPTSVMERGGGSEPRTAPLEAWFAIHNAQRALIAQPLILRTTGLPSDHAACYAHMMSEKIHAQPACVHGLLSRFKDHPMIDDAYTATFTALLRAGCPHRTPQKCTFVHVLGDIYDMPVCKHGMACPTKHSTCVLIHESPTVVTAVVDSTPSASMQAMAQAMAEQFSVHLSQALVPVLAAIKAQPLATTAVPQPQPHQAQPTVLLQPQPLTTTVVHQPVRGVTFAPTLHTMPEHTSTEEIITPGMMEQARLDSLQMHDTALGLMDYDYDDNRNLDYDEEGDPHFSMMTISAVLYTALDYQLSHMVACFSRAHAFTRVPILDTTSTPVQHIIHAMIDASPFSYEDACQDKGFCTYVQLYIRLHCAPGNISPLLSYQTSTRAQNRGIYYLPRTSTESVFPSHDLDREQVIALALALHHYNQDNPSLQNMRLELFVDSFAAYFKNAPFMRMVNVCMLTYRSSDYDPTVSMPVRPALRGNHIIIQPLHPLYNNFSAMLQRTSNPQGSHHNVQVEPCWTGCFWPGFCITKDRYAFFSYTIWVDHILGTKPNHTHSSSSQFCVDRINNALHYSVDNIRWASNATNFWNRAPQTSNSIGAHSTSSNHELRRIRTIFRILKRKHGHSSS